MLLSDVATLLFAVLISFVKCAEIKPSSLREMMQRYLAKRDELLQRGKRTFTPPTVQMHPGVNHGNPNARYLQATSAPTKPPLCNADQSVNFNDDVDMSLYQGEFETACSCSEDENEDEIMRALDALLSNPNSTTSLAEEFNTLVDMTFSNISFSCINGCESCYNGVCGILEIAQDDFTGFTKPNFTEAQILSNSYDSYLFYTEKYSFNNCFDYTSGSTFDGKLCFGVDLEGGSELLGGEVPCFIEYDNVACNSCSFDSDFKCYVADCTNIDSSAAIDSCNATGFVGPFVFLELLEAQTDIGRNVTVGSCDVPTAPVGPSGPMASPTAPVTAPVKSPTAATPSATSGSAMLVYSMNVLIFGLVVAALK